MHKIQQLNKSSGNGDIMERLNSLDWDFVDNNAKKDLHSIHPYPAKFIPEIPQQLIEELGVPNGSVVFDPFCGSGTTLRVAQKNGYRSVGVDLNPIACLISTVKTMQLPDGILECAQSMVEQAQNYNIENIVTDIPNIDHWFKKEIQSAVLSLKYEIEEIKDQSIHDALSLALSSILVRVSNQDSDTRYAAVEKKISKKDVYQLFLKACEKIVNSKKVEAEEQSECQIINSDILSVSKSDIDETVGLVVTSPPYPNAYEYWLYHKYRMFWLGFDPISVKKQEIGARAHFFKKNHHTKHDFFRQMKGTLQLVKDVLVENGYAAFVVGRSRIHGEYVDNAELIKNAAEEVGLVFVGKIVRNIKQGRKSFNLAHAKIKQETIVILKQSNG